MDGSLSDADLNLSAARPERADEGGGNRFQRAIAAWKDINLSTLVSSLDTAASDLVSHQRDSLIQRKELAQKTKDFRKLDDAGKLSENKSLLKAYQSFIDLLTNQSKSTSSAFLQLYSALSEAPDPYPLLEASVDSFVDSEETVPKLTTENAQLHKQVDQLTNQLEKAEQRLEQESLAKKALEDAEDAKSKEVENSWVAVLREKEDNWVAKERMLEQKVEHQERLLKELKASLEVSQRLGHRGDDDEHAGQTSRAAAAELELISSELDRANNRLAEVEGRNEQLRFELAQSASHARKSVVVEEEPEYLHLQSENSSLLRKLETARFEKESRERQLHGEMRGLERELSSVKEDCGLMKERIKKFGDYDEMKKELEVLRAVEFATGSDFPDQADEQSNGQSNQNSEGEKGDTLEKLLLARNKKLNDDLTMLRVSNQDLKKQLEALHDNLSSTDMELERYKALASTLESDLVKLQEGATSSSAMSVAGSRMAPSTFGGSGSIRKGGGGGRVSPTSSVISGFDPSGFISGAGAANPGILPMITAQRDRFKKRIAELETELSKSRQTVTSLRSEIASLQKDNISLYEKSRYVSTYTRNQAPPTSSLTNSTFSSPNNNNNTYSTSSWNPTSIPISIPNILPWSSLSHSKSPTPSPSSYPQSHSQPQSHSHSHLPLDSRYRSAYEQKLSPFAAFRGRESARVFRRMLWPERLAYRAMKVATATRASRNVFALYCAALHVFVLVVLVRGEWGCGGGGGVDGREFVGVDVGGVYEVARGGEDTWGENVLN